MPARTLPTHALSLHPKAGLVPEMPPDQYARFLADVKVRGIIDPIELLPGSRTVIEGRTRLKAAIEAGIPFVPVVEADLLNESDVLYMMRAALLRRHLSKSQAAALAVEIESEFARAAKERQRAGGAKGGRNKGVEKIPQPSGGTKARDEAAAAAGVSPRYVTDAKKVKEKDPLLFEQVKNGQATLSDAKKKIAPEPGPIVCKPVGSMALKDVPGFPAAVATSIAAKGVKTLADLERSADGLRVNRGQYLDGIDNGIVYPAIKSLGVLHADALVAGDAIIDLFKVDPMKATPPPPPAKSKAAPDALKPCPFCGSDKLLVVKTGGYGTANEMAAYVRCDSCGAQGPYQFQRSMPVAKVRDDWNRRTK